MSEVLLPRHNTRVYGPRAMLVLGVELTGLRLEIQGHRPARLERHQLELPGGGSHEVTSPEPRDLWDPWGARARSTLR